MNLSFTYAIFNIIANFELQVRLIGSSNNMIRKVEVYHPTLGWGTVCGKSLLSSGFRYFSITEANVVCRQLGYSGANTTIFFGYYYDETSPVLLSNVQCSGNESFIWDCSHSGWNNAPGYCRQYRDVAVGCY